MTRTNDNMRRTPDGDQRGHAGGDGLEASLRAALAADAKTERDTVVSLLSDALRGQSRLLATITLVAQVGMVAGAVASALAFFGATGTRDQILYATLFLWTMSAAGLIKAWFWMQIHRNRVLREVKRVELQVARLAEAHGAPR